MLHHSSDTAPQTEVRAECPVDARFLEDCNRHASLSLNRDKKAHLLYYTRVTKAESREKICRLARPSDEWFFFAGPL